MFSFCSGQVRYFLRGLAALIVALGLHGGESFSSPLLPDLFSWEDEALSYMYGGAIDLASEPGRVLYRFDVAIPNQGDGPFEVFEITFTNQTQNIYQNIYDSEGGFTQVLMGNFPVLEDAPFGHLYLEGLAQYNLREVTSGNGVGPIVATQLKTSHGVLDSVSYDLSLPGAPQSRVYNSVNSNPLGVSIGWADLYSRSIPEQRIDVTDVPSGQYWLEVVIDPFNLVQETDETNNTTRILMNLVNLGPIFLAADFDEDADVDRFDFETWETNLGNTAALHDEGDADFDQDVDGRDFLIWQRQWTGEASLATAPEPSTLLLTLGLSALVLQKRRRRDVRSTDDIS